MCQTEKIMHSSNDTKRCFFFCFSVAESGLAFVVNLVSHLIVFSFFIF